MIRHTACHTALVFLVGFGTAAKADLVGDIRVCYNCQDATFKGLFGVQDGPIFAIDNTSGSALTNGVLSIAVGGDNAIADSFSVGTIAPGATVYIETGVSNDGLVHPSGGFFFVTGSVRDTSDVGPASDNVPFSFTGTQGILAVNSGVFTPAATRGPTNDGTIARMNFLGGPDDGPCNDCFGPEIVANLNTPNPSVVPEPSSLVPLGTCLAALAVGLRVRRLQRLPNSETEGRRA
jgi:hypothetical protein